MADNMFDEMLTVYDETNSGRNWEKLGEPTFAAG